MVYGIERENYSRALGLSAIEAPRMINTPSEIRLYSWEYIRKRMFSTKILSHVDNVLGYGAHVSPVGRDIIDITKEVIRDGSTAR